MYDDAEEEKLFLPHTINTKHATGKTWDRGYRLSSQTIDDYIIVYTTLTCVYRSSNGVTSKNGSATIGADSNGRYNNVLAVMVGPDKPVGREVGNMHRHIYTLTYRSLCSI